MRQVIGAEGEEVRHFGDLAGHQRRPGEFDHGAHEEVIDARFGGFGAHDIRLVAQFLDRVDERDHDLGADDDALRPALLGRRKDCARLHLGDLRVDYPQAAAAEAEHRVLLTQALYLLLQALERNRHILRQRADVFVPNRQELVQRWVERADSDGQAVHLSEDADEVLALQRFHLGQGSAPFVCVFGDDHLANGHDPVAFEKHVLGAAEADALRAKRARDLRIVWAIAVGPHTNLAKGVRPAHQRGEVCVQVWLHRLHAADQHLTGRAVHGQ